MFGNSPTFRFILYVVAVVVQFAAFFVRPINDGWADAVQNAANFAGAVAGVTAIGNISRTPSVGPAEAIDVDAFPRS